MMKAARLKGDLLSRKGAARPISGVAAGHGKPTGLAPRPALTAVDPGSVGPMPEGAADLPPGKRDPALKRDRYGRVRVSLRLDPHRHLRLRLLAAHGRMSLQEILIAALDAYLSDEAQDLPCDCLHAAGGSSHDDETRDETRAAGVQDPE